MGDKKKQLTFNQFLGAVCVIAFACIGIFIFCLYTVPSFTPMGMGGVAVQGKYMTYVDPELEYIFDQQNFIIESSNTAVFIRIRKEGQLDQGYVQMFEEANGISFNSMKRSQVDFVECIDDHGDVYTKIRVREPKGLMTRQARLYINLKHENVVKFNARVGVDMQDAMAGYNFILDTGRSPVTFDFDDAASDLRINRLDVRGSGNVHIAKPARARVNYLLANSGSANISIQSPITTLAEIKGNSSSIFLGDVNEMTVEGYTHNIHAKGVAGNVISEATNATINIAGRVGGDITAHGENLNISAYEVNNLEIKNPLNLAKEGDRIPERILNGSVNISKINGASNVRMEAGSLTLGAHGSYENKSKDGETTETVQLGVYGNVNIDKRQGGANVRFANDNWAKGSCIIRARDGDINVFGAQGYVDIEIVSAGSSNVSVVFAYVYNNSKIIIGGSREPNTQGKITVTLMKEIGAIIHVVGSSKIEDHITPLENQKDEYANCNDRTHHTTTKTGCNTFDINGGVHLLNLLTANTVAIYKGY